MTDENSTRDMTVENKTLLNAHLLDCSEFRKRIFEKLKLQDKQLSWQTWVLTLIIGIYFTINWFASHPEVLAKVAMHP